VRFRRVVGAGNVQALIHINMPNRLPLSATGKCDFWLWVMKEYRQNASISLLPQESRPLPSSPQVFVQDEDFQKPSTAGPVTF
jgi:hypothetical protein